MKCMVANCNSSNDGKASGCSFFSFPVDPVLTKKWIRFCRQAKVFNPKTSHICMKHFVAEDFENNFEYEMGFANKRLLNRGVVPTVFKEEIENTERAERLQRRENKAIVLKLLEENSATTSTEVANVTNDDVQDMATTECSCEGNVDGGEIYTLEIDRLENISPSHTINVENEVYILKINDLQNMLKTSQDENFQLRKQNRKHRNEIKMLKRNFENRENRLLNKVKLLQKRATKAEIECHNLKEKLDGFITVEKILDL